MATDMAVAMLSIFVGGGGLICWSMMQTAIEVEERSPGIVQVDRLQFRAVRFLAMLTVPACVIATLAAVLGWLLAPHSAVLYVVTATGGGLAAEATAIAATVTSLAVPNWQMVLYQDRCARVLARHRRWKAWWDRISADEPENYQDPALPADENGQSNSEQSGAGAGIAGSTLGSIVQTALTDEVPQAWCGGCDELRPSAEMKWADDGCCWLCKACQAERKDPGVNKTVVGRYPRDEALRCPSRSHDSSGDPIGRSERAHRCCCRVKQSTSPARVRARVPAVHPAGVGLAMGSKPRRPPPGSSTPHQGCTRRSSAWSL
ncbi:hypothetical protein BHQ16_22190 [Mycobacterium shimoidei]|nr:hypothetical protein [Mycobacterium shimoidei]ODR05207.1 hypothetical protein BHQ16_22190 [Mycobacterium shimoidei]